MKADEGAAPRPSNVGLAKRLSKDPLAILSSFACDGEGSMGDDEFSLSKTRWGSGERERRFFGLGAAGESSSERRGDMV